MSTPHCRSVAKASGFGENNAMRIILPLALMGCLGAATASAFAASARDAEAGNLPAEVVAAVRVQRFFDLAQQWAEMANDLQMPAEAAKALPRAFGSFLRNPDLRGLTAQGFIEFLLFDPAKIEGYPLAVALAVDDAAAYRALIANQPAIREESTADEIAAYRENTAEGAVRLFLATPVGKRLVLYGFSAPAVRKARDLYLAAGENGILTDRPGMMIAQIYPQRLIASNRQWLSHQAAALRADLLAALAGAALSDDHPLGRGIAYWLDGLLAMAEQIALLEINAALDADKVTAACHIALSAGRLPTILEEMSNEALRLRQIVPDGCAVWQDMALSNSLLRALAEAAAECFLLATEGMAGQDLRAEARALLAEAEAAGPREMLAFSWGKSSRSAPASFRLIRWQYP
ncbi:MAG: hypothetical protein N3A66_09150, partial [Planctomycetota bacterium]|nr:hypothetical protein [Planctomycetota bacterium]